MKQLGLFGDDKTVRERPVKETATNGQLRLFADREVLQIGVTAHPTFENRSYSMPGGLFEKSPAPNIVDRTPPATQRGLFEGKPVKALSIRQPWAWLICQGIKTVENRTWATEYRGAFLVHASKQFALSAGDLAALREAVQADYGVLIPDDLPTGGIVGQADIVDCVTACTDDNDDIWHEPGQYAFLVRNARPLPFRPCAGKLKFFEPLG